MKFARHSQLGLIPSWQFSTDPAVNPKINPHVTFPPGVYQTTPQPFLPYYQGPESAAEPNQLGRLGARYIYDRRRRRWMALAGLGLVGLLGIALG